MISNKVDEHVGKSLNWKAKNVGSGQQGCCNQNTGQLISLNRRAVFVSITRAQRGLISDIVANTPLVDRARGFWHVNLAKAMQCDLLIAVNRGIIEGVWEIDKKFRWQSMSANAISTRRPAQNVDPTRRYCQVIKNCPPERALLLNQRITKIIGMDRMRGPIQYG